MKVLIAEFGTPWLPYLVRKMDHAALLGRPAKFGKLPGRPSRIFKEHFVVAPFPEENIQRPMEIVGPDVLVFGSDFPHAEGLPDPVQYATQLKGLDDVTVKKIMRDNLANFLGIYVEQPDAGGGRGRWPRPPPRPGPRRPTRCAATSALARSTSISSSKDLANDATPSSSSTPADVVHVDADRAELVQHRLRPRPRPTSTVRATVPWSSNASMVASGRVLTVSGPISWST